jgi:hypothetical protein
MMMGHTYLRKVTPARRRTITMKESITKLTKRFTGSASLAAIGMKLKQLDLFGPIRQGVQISQKTVKYTPIDKLYDAFITLLAGADGLVGPCAGHTLGRGRGRSPL